MKLSTYIVILMANILGGFMTVHAQALSFSFDKGGVEIAYTHMEEPYVLTYTLPAQCEGTRIVIDQDESGAVAHHEGEPCSEGARFKLLIQDTNSIYVKLEAGAISLTDTKQLLGKISSLNAKVDAGSISSSVSDIKVTRINSYAGARAQYINRENFPFAPSLRLEVKAGAVSL